MLLGPLKDFELFGQTIGDPSLAETVKKLYMNSTAPSSRTTSKTGENHYRRFALKYTILPLTPFTPLKLTLKGLTLTFLIATKMMQITLALQFLTIRVT